MKQKFVLLLVAVFALQIAEADDKPYTPALLPSREEILRIQADDIVLGCKDAKHVIIEYSSLSCPHCAQYYKNVFPRIKSEIINKCKAKYVLRDFPTTKSALKGVAVARCLSKSADGSINGEEFFKFIQLLFNAQATWAFSNEYEANLNKIFSITGIPQDKISVCMANKDLMYEIVSRSFTAMKALNMSRSPSIFVDGVEIPLAKFDPINDAIK
jgi:protein-disulfide isomerase